MFKYIIKRLLQLIPVLFGVSLIVCLPYACMRTGPCAYRSGSARNQGEYGGMAGSQWAE